MALALAAVGIYGVVALTLGAAMLFLGLVALTASLVPAYQVARIDAAQMLKLST